MSWMYGDDYEYADSRLNGTIVTHNSLPFYVNRIRLDGIAEGSYLGGDRAEVEAKSLDLLPVKLGYVNADRDCSYMARKPMRRDWRQGLRPENMASLDAKFDPFGMSLSLLKDTILGIYPKFADLLKPQANPFVDGFRMRAWDRHWALAADKSVWYKGEKVGKLVNDIPTLLDKYSYLKEALEETL